MNKAQISKIWFGFLVLSVIFVIPTQLVLSALDEYGLYQHGWERVLNTACFFTIQSNILVGVSSFCIYKNKSSLLIEVIKFASLIGIFVTGVIYHVMLAKDADLHGIEIITDLFMHSIIPIMYVLGWMIFVPRGLAGHRVSSYALLFPVLWSIFTLLKGPLVGFYPYPFMDVDYLGYAKALTNMGVITLLFLAIAYVFHKYDEILAGRK